MYDCLSLWWDTGNAVPYVQDLELSKFVLLPQAGQTIAPHASLTARRRAFLIHAFLVYST